MSGHRSPLEPQLSSTGFNIQQDPLRQLHNQAQNLIAQIQSLLDDQSEALFRKDSHLRSLEESTMQFPPRAYEQTSLMGPQPKSLSEARNGLRAAMYALADIKSREAAVCDDLATERRQFSSSLSKRTAKASKLRDELTKIRSSPQSSRAEKLRTERTSVELEISGLEKKLTSLQARRKKLDEDISELDNVIASRAASYDGSLKEVVVQTGEFLKMHGQSSVETVMEVWRTEEEAYTKKMQAAFKEEEALNLGVSLWEDALTTVRNYERTLRQKLNGGAEKADVLRELNFTLEKAIEDLEEMAEKAAKQSWRLLEVCIGAELAAFKEAAEALSRKDNAGNLDQ